MGLTMRRIVAVIGGILVMGGALAYFLMYRKPPPFPTVIPQTSLEQLQHNLMGQPPTSAPYSQESMDAHIRQRAEQILRTRSLEAQLAVFDQILATHPNDPVALQRAAELRKQIEAINTP